MRQLFRNIPLLLSLFLILPIVSFSSPPSLRFKTIARSEGLSNSTVECILQDSKGFIWIGTRDGLNKYDGYEITVYKMNPKNANSLSDNYVRYIYEDRQNNLWIGTSNGLNLFNRHNGTFTRYKHRNNESRTLSNNQVNCIYEDNENNLFISTYGGGLNRLNRRKGTFSVIHDPMSKNVYDNFVTYIFQDSNRNLWVATEGGLKIYKNGNLHNYSLFKDPEINITVITEDRHSNLWIGTTDNGLYRFNLKMHDLKCYSHNEKDFSSISSNTIRDVLIDKKGNIWVGCTNGGLNLLLPTKNSFYRYSGNDVYNSGALLQKTVSTLYEDRQGNLWIGTHRGGVKLLTPKSQKFELFQWDKDKNSLSYNDVKAFYEDSYDNLWIGTDGGGLNKFNHMDGSFKHFRFNPYNPNSLSSDAVLDIVESPEKKLWVGTWGGGLNLLDPKTGKIKRFLNKPVDNNSISSNYITKLLKDRQGNIWVGTYYGGLNILNRQKNTFTRMTTDPKNQSSLYGNNIISLIEDLKGNLWIGTDDGGLNCYDISTNKFRHYFHNEERTPNIEVIFCDSKGRLWVGQSGLYLYNAAEDKFILYSENTVLRTVQIKGMLEDRKGNLWISTTDGLIRFNPDRCSLKRFNKEDGLQGEEFEANACLKTKYGEMYFGGLNGFNVFNPDNIIINKFKPPVYLTGLQIFNKRVTLNDPQSPLKADINFAREINLTYKQSTFSISFAALNFTSSGNNQYAYKLEGFDLDWNYIGQERKASYTNVEPGEYTFLVKAANNDGIWNDQATAIKIIISPPFWQTLWFRVLIVIIILYVAYQLFNFLKRLEMEKLEKAKKDELHQIQLQFFTNISHELRLPLTLILGRLENLVQEIPSLSTGHNFRSLVKNTNRLMNLINELMDFRKVNSQAIVLKVALSNPNLFLDEITEEFFEPAYEKNIVFRVKKAILTKDEIWFDRQILEKIILNLIHNAIKYTPAEGKIGVDLSIGNRVLPGMFKNEFIIDNGYKAKKNLIIRVFDTGIGISKDSLKLLFERYYRITESHVGSGIGLAFVKSLVTLHKGNIYVYSERNKGTEIVITIPCSREDYQECEIWKGSDSPIGARLESIVPVLDFRGQEPFVNPPIPELNQGNIKKHILVVEDNVEMRELLRERLEPYYHITEADNGADGLKKAKEEFPDLIISDIMMPTMDGIDFCKALREDIETSHVPFLFLTAKDAVQSKIEGIDSGADYYFSKPINFNYLLLTIRNIFERREKLKEHYSKDHHLEIRELVHSQVDKQFMDNLLEIVDRHIKDPNLDADMVSREIGMSKTKVYNKIKAITGSSTGEFIRTVRLKKAVEIMTNEDVLIADVMFRVGMQTQSYFSKVFKKEFGKSPTQFLQDISPDRKKKALKDNASCRINRVRKAEI